MSNAKNGGGGDFELPEEPFKIFEGTDFDNSRAAHSLVGLKSVS